MADDYTVTSVMQTQSLAPTGQLQDEVEATFTTIPEGAQGTVRVRRTGDWSTALVSAIEAEVAQLKSVFGA
jgi:uncharacterized protein YndB with AHSA1/START domain